MESLFLNNMATSVADNIIVPTSILVSATPVDNQVLSYLAGQFKWSTITSGGGGSGVTGDLIESTSNVLTINGGVGAVNGLGTTIKVNIGSTSDTVCAGNDSRLSDSRVPLSHTQAFNTITSTPTTLAGYSITDGTPETTTTIGTLINGATVKSTPVDADMVGLMDSQATNVLKKLSWSNIKSTLKTYFDGLYTLANLGGVATNDSRLSDARTPTAHTQAFSTITSTPTTLAGYSISDAVPTSRTINSKALSSNIILSASDISAEPTLTKGNLTEVTSSVLTITNGTGVVIGSGTTIQVKTGITSGTVALGNDSRFIETSDEISGGAPDTVF